MLSVKNLVKTYKTGKGANIVTALNSVSIDFPETGFVFLLGKSGSGKSTLLNVIGGLDTFDSGEILIKGKSSKNFSQSDFDSYRNTFIGFIFQEYNILENFTVAKNLALAIELQGKKASKEKVNELLAQVEMLEYANRKPNQLSGGQKQRVAIARALIKNPEIIMADEPTGALDSNTGKQVMETLKELSKTKLVIVVSHDRDFAETYGDRVIELKDGDIISDVTKKEVQSVETNEGVKVIDDNIVYIKKGHKISREEFNKLYDKIAEKSETADTFISFDNETNGKLKESARITDDGNREKFLQTTSDDINIKEYDPNSLKLIKSRLKGIDSFKMGASSLKHKVGKLIFTILLSFLAFTMFGVVDALSCWNRASSVYEAMTLTNQRNLVLRKRETFISHGFTDYDDIVADKSDIDALSSQFQNHIFKGVVGESASEIDVYNGEYMLRLDNSSYNNNPFYEVVMSGYASMTETEITFLGFDIQGRLPENDGEVCISKHLYDIIVTLSENDANKVTSIDNLYIKTNDYYDREGGESNEKVKVVGLIDDKTDLSILENLPEGQKGQTAIFMYAEMIQYSYSNLIYVTANKFDEIYKRGNDSYVYMNYGDESFTSFNKDTFYSLDEKYESFKNGSVTNIYKHPTTNEYIEKDSNSEYGYMYNSKGERIYEISPWYILDCKDWNWDYYYEDSPEYQSFYTMYGGDTDDDGIPDSFVKQETSFADNICYYVKSDLNLFADGTNSGLGENEIIIPYEYFQHQYSDNYMTIEQLQQKIEEGMTISVKRSYRGQDVMTLKVVGISRGYNLYTSDANIDDFNSTLFNGYNFILSSLNGTMEDVALINYCEGGNEDGIKYITINSATFILDNMEDIINSASKVLFYVAIGFAVFAAVLLMNFISVSISYKKREIGVLRALGARGIDIFGIFLNESTVISVINFLLAIVATFVTCYIINTALLSSLGIDIVLLTPGIRQVILIFAVSWGSAAIASFIPSMKISKKKPIDAINNR